MQDIFEFKDCITPIKAIPSINVYGTDKLGEYKPLFTIAIPTYKRVTTLSETIESSLNQKNFDDYNIIVVDNNPERNDETEVFMQKYKDHPKVTYYKNSENVGMAGNWNKCICLSISNNVILLHDDDILSPYALYYMKKVLSTKPYQWGLIKPSMIRFVNKKDITFNTVSNIRLTRLRSINYFIGSPTGAPTGVLLNKKYYMDIGGADSEHFPSFDYILSYHLNLKYSTYIMDIPLVGYRVGINESLSANTMDLFYDHMINSGMQIMSKNHVPMVIAHLLMRCKCPVILNALNKYYNMPNYNYDFSRYGLKNEITWFSNRIMYIWDLILVLFAKLNSKNISI